MITPPWLSSALLLLAYGVLGYGLVEAVPLWLTGAIATAVILVKLITLTAFFQTCAQLLGEWFSEDVIHLALVLTAAFFVAVVLVWHHIFENLLLILAAEFLLDVDLKTAGVDRGISCALSVALLTGGFSISWAIHAMV